MRHTTQTTDRTARHCTPHLDETPAQPTRVRLNRGRFGVPVAIATGFVLLLTSLPAAAATQEDRAVRQSARSDAYHAAHDDDRRGVQRRDQRYGDDRRHERRYRDDHRHDRDKHYRDRRHRDRDYRGKHYRDRHYRDRHYRDRHYRDRHYRDRHYRDRQYRDYRHRDRRHHGHYDHGYRHRHHRPFEIPRKILRNTLRSLKSFFLHEIYYKAHRHHHQIYSFPVYDGYDVVYRPFAYCEGDLYSVGYYDDHGSIHWSQRPYKRHKHRGQEAYCDDFGCEYYF